MNQNTIGRSFRLLLIAAVVALVAALAIAGAVFAEESAGIPPPTGGGGGGGAQPTEQPDPATDLFAGCTEPRSVIIATLPVIEAPIVTNQLLVSESSPFYSIGGELQFVWTPLAFPEGVTGAYRIAIRQFLAPTANLGIFNDSKVAFHQAQDGTFFTYGDFNVGEQIFTNIPTVIVIEPYAVNLVFDPASGQTIDTYVPLGPGIQSCPFAFTVN